MPRISQCFVLWSRGFGGSCFFIEFVLTTFRIFCIPDAVAFVASPAGERLLFQGG